MQQNHKSIGLDVHKERSVDASTQIRAETKRSAVGGGLANVAARVSRAVSEIPTVVSSIPTHR